VIEQLIEAQQAAKLLTDNAPQRESMIALARRCEKANKGIHNAIKRKRRGLRRKAEQANHPDETDSSER